jgi:hypothetical protein
MENSLHHRDVWVWHWIQALLCNLLRCQRKRSLARLRVTFESGITVSGVNLEFSMNTEQFVVVTVAPKTAHGNPAAIDGDVAFTVDHPELVIIEQQDAETAKLVGVQTASVPPEGVSVLVTATFDADLGTGVVPVVASGALLILSPQAATAEVTFGEAQDQ